jgi:hypothetical protein
MQLAEKRDVMTDEDGSNDKTTVVSSDGSKAPPAASLTASLIQRGYETWRDEDAEPHERQTMPDAAPEAVSETSPEAAPETSPEAAPEALEEPVGARAQQAILEEAFAEPAPAVAVPPIERAEFQSARDSAANWRLRSGPSAGFWERLIRDVSIFTIFFAVLVFAILQTM